MTTTRLAAASHRPFSNGTEGSAWMNAWCSYCVHDHGEHDDSFVPACDIIAIAMADGPWPDAWLPEPDDGSFALPSRMICGAFEPCTRGSCTGDPGAKPRAERIAEVAAYWREHGAEIKL